MEKLNKIFSELFNLKPEQIKSDLKLADVEGWDSLTHMELITKIEDVYKIELDGDEIASMLGVGEIMEVLRAKKITL
ncbi:MAG: acyl carrier protein [Ignavibacteriae bacterium]|nr:acyl carrier protein [Ignavibacteriota bacterium]